MPLRDDLLKPIPGDNPSGANLRYDPITDKIKEARREDIDAPQGAWKRELKVADWPLVIKLAGDTIANKTKDLQLAVWLVEAHARRESFAVLPPAFRFLHGLIEQYWDTLYPELEDGDVGLRAAPLDWLGSKFAEILRVIPITANKLGWVNYKESRTLGYEADANTEDKRRLRKQLIEEGKPTAEEFDQAVDETPKAFYEGLYSLIPEAQETLQVLGELCDEKFGDESPSFVKTKAALDEVFVVVKMFLTRKGGPSKAPELAAVEEPSPPPPPVASQAAAAAAPAPAPVVQAAPAPVPAAAPVAAAGVPAGEPSDLPDAARRVAAIAAWIRKQDEYKAEGYLITRAFRWGEIRYYGQQIQPPMLEAPSAELRARLRDAYAAQDWNRLLAVAEDAAGLPCGRGWLDIQFYAVKALEAKGHWFAFVSGAIKTNLLALLTDLPNLPECFLTDGMPTASPEVKAWITADILPKPPEPVYITEPVTALDVEPEVESPPEPEPVEVAPPPPAQTAPSIPIEIKVDAVPPSMDDDLAAQEEVLRRAIEASRDGRDHEAIEILSKELASERSERGRFKRKVQIAHLFLSKGRHTVAYPLLEQLASEIDRRKLEEWEPGEVLAYPLSLLLQCLRARRADDAALDRLYSRICCLDPVRALTVME